MGSTSMEGQMCLLILISVFFATYTLAAPPERNCSISLVLRPGATSDKDSCTLTEDAGDSSGACDSLSAYLERYKTLVAVDDCLDLRLYPGTYTLNDYSTTLEYSAVIRALGSGVTVTCEPGLEGSSTTGSPLWFQRHSVFSSYPSSGTSSVTADKGEFFVQIEGVQFENCTRPLQFDAMDYVGISNCSFT